MKYLKQTSVNTLVLAQFFDLAQTEGPGYTEKDMAELFRPWVSSHRISMAISAAQDAGYVEDIDPANPDYVYAITRQGYKKAEELYLSEKSNFRRFLEGGIPAYFAKLESDGPDQVEADQVPASDRFVQLGDNLPGYGEVASTVEAADEAVRSSNQIGAEEKSWIRVHLKLGIDLLRTGGNALRSALSSLLVEPLKAALKEASEEGVKAAIKVALKAIKTYLGVE